MDNDRISGASDQAKGSIKQAAGKATGDVKLQAEGTLDKAKGRGKSAIGERSNSSQRQLITVAIELCCRQPLMRSER